MTLSTTEELVSAARTAGGGVAAFNVITLEHAEAVVAAADGLGMPVIVQISENALAFHRGDPAPIGGAVQALAAASGNPVALHLDHATSLDLCRRAADAGYSSVMFDASSLDDDANVALTFDAAEWARDRAVWIEAELGAIGGKGGAHTPGVRTVPAEATDFVARTGVDGLAVAVGSEHAMNARTAHLDHDLIARLQTAVPVPLVLHGSSGVPDDEIRRAIGAGIVKVNVGTALNIAFTSALAASLRAEGASPDPRPHLAKARAGIESVVSAMLPVIAGPREHSSL